MQRTRKIVFFAAACALTVGAFSLLGPRAVKAAVATLVQVVNTVNNRDVDNPAHQPYQQEQFTNSVSTPIAVTTVPAGKRLVIEHFSAEASSSGGISRFFVSVAADSANPGNALFIHFVGPMSHGPSFGQDIYLASAPLRLYVDQGQTLVLEAVGDGSGFAFMSVSGYFVDLP